MPLEATQKEALHILSTVASNDMSESQRNLAEKFIIDSKGDLDLRDALSNLTSQDKADMGFREDVVNNMIRYTHQTRDLSETQGKPSSLKEYAMLNDMVKAKTSVDFFQSLLQCQDGSPLQRFQKKLEKSESIQAEMEINNLSNLEKLVKNNPGVSSSTRDEASHIHDSLQGDEFVLRDYLYSNGYEVNIQNLISDENKKALEKKYGSKWAGIIQEKYALIEKRVHDSALRGDVAVTSKAETRQRKSLIFSDNKSTNMEEYNKKQAGKMICSAFAPTTMARSIKKLNAELQIDALKAPPSLPLEKFLKTLTEQGVIKKVAPGSELKSHIKPK